MTKVSIIFIFSLLLFGFSQLRYTSAHHELNEKFQEAWKDYELIYQNWEDVPLNPLPGIEILDTHAVYQLGFVLFFAELVTVLEDGKVVESSCASCHTYSNSGFAGVKKSIGFGGSGVGMFREPILGADTVEVTGIASPTILNSGYNERLGRLLWDGSIGDPEDTRKLQNALINEGYNVLDIQILVATKGHIINWAKMQKDPLCLLLTEVGFGSSELTLEHIVTAITVLERLTLSSNTKLSYQLRGFNVMNKSELRGSLIFAKDCAYCHSGPSLGNENMVERVVIGGVEREGKVPQLFNLKEDHHYLSDDSEGTIIGAVNKHLEIMPGYSFNTYKGKEKRDLNAFLKNVLYDPTAFEPVLN